MKRMGLGLILWLCLMSITPVMAQESTGKPITAATIHQLQRVGMLGKGRILDSTWTQDGSALIVLSSVGVWLYDANQWEAEPDFLPVHSEMPYGRLAYHPGTDRIAAGGMIGTAWVWDLGSRQLVYTLDNAGGTVSRVTFNSDGSLLATQTTRLIRIWDLATGERLQSVKELSELQDVTFEPSGHTPGVDPNTQEVHSPTDGKRLATLTGYLTGFSSVAVNADGTLVASGESDGTLRLWEVASGQQLMEQQATAGRINDLAFSSDDSQLAVASSDATVQVCSVPDLTCPWVLKGHLGPVTTVVFSPDGSRLASGDADGTVRLWEADTTIQILYTTPHVNGLAFSPDGTQFATGTGEGVIRLWDVATGIALNAFSGHLGGAYGVAFGCGGHCLVSGGGDGTIQALEIPSGNLISTYETPHRIEIIQSVVLSTDGSLAMFGMAGDCYDCTLHFWNPAAGKMVRKFPSLREVADMAISRDGTLLATVDASTIMLWGIS